MKPLLFSLLFFISALSFAQDKGSISGVLSDSGSIDEPLVLAKVSVKETGDETVSDESGFFKFENIDEGTYTLLFRFVGYETKAVETHVVSGKNSEIKLSLEASTISLDDLALTLASATSETVSKAVLTP
ncbi:carboxypeptidase-like regulatory domain-containing protein [Aestuariivivens sediminicola]|uniref:carboxypeptidase-like regulatory domain-containing protein n=1 Tax=Aestuariivivens sediminicola TaxID=2913560 RepID=UPI001F596FC0|nr:carboxypeptidase-like regulatory domain-containing protein [Aestuariivivens sediminicola]